MQADVNRDLRVSSQTAWGVDLKHYVVRCSAVCLLYRTRCATGRRSQRGMRKERRERMMRRRRRLSYSELAAKAEQQSQKKSGHTMQRFGAMN